MARRNWYPGSLAEQAAMYANVLVKIGSYEATLPLTPAQVARIELICSIFLAVYEYVEQMRATTSSLVEWRDTIFTGEPMGDPAPAAPAFSVVTMPVGAFIGIVSEFKDLRDLIVASPGYRLAIGEDLMIVGAEIEEPSAPTVTPSLTVTTSTGYVVNIAGSLQGSDAIRVEYQRQGQTAWSIVGFGTKMPMNVTITPATPGQPENGQIRAIFIRKNAEYGNFSPNYPITIS